MTFASTDSKVLGYNNNSGMLYRTNNGLRQFAMTRARTPSWNSPSAEYVNPQNEKELLATMQDGNSDVVNPNGKTEIPTLPNADLSDGGFENRGRVVSQTDQKPINRLRLPEKVVDLVQGDTGGLPTTEQKAPRGQAQAVSKFGSFLSGLNLNVKAPVKKGPTARTQYK
tara:strand:- start:784 stop:1290 length:507 start_codon:yes stop_codon:yes gene_type:complete